MSLCNFSSPALEDFASTWLTAKTGDLFNPPALTNFFGALQAAPDILAVQHLTFAPYSFGDSILGTVVLNDCALHASGLPIEYRWRPDRIERRMAVDGLSLESVTVMAVRAQYVVSSLKISNRSTASRIVRLRLRAGDGVVKSSESWRTPTSPKEAPAISTTPWEGTPPEFSRVRNRQDTMPEGDGFIFFSQTSPAVAIEGTSPAPLGLDRRWMDFEWTLEGGQSQEVFFYVSVGEELGSMLRDFAQWRTRPSAVFEIAEADWSEEIRSAFTPGNTRYSGHVPSLISSEESLKAIYYNAIISVIYFKREHPAAHFRRTYTTLMPRYWVTTSFINDWSLTALLLVMLDPACVREMLEVWLDRDIHRHFGTEYVSGDSTGNWYSCNDYAMTKLITTYLRVTGDISWLNKDAGARTVREHLLHIADHYRTLDRGSGLADYGDRNSLLEAVGTYEHEVASLNAANVWILREIAELSEFLGDRIAASRFRSEATALLPRVLSLYAAGEGYWNCRHPDGSMVPVRHVWDFVHTLNFLHSDLSETQIREMMEFFRRELMTPNWLAALSPLDEDSAFSLRPDHQWNGSYPGWVALAVGALAKTGYDDLLAKWMPGLARSSRQGPYSQAHFVETYAEVLAGGARKAPTEWPYINDWAILCAGSFFDVIVSDLFGIDFGYRSISATPRRSLLGKGTMLENIPFRGELYRFSSDTSSHLELMRIT